MSVVAFNNTGFTLIEVIITLIIAGIMSAMVLSFVSSTNLYSVNSVDLLRNNLNMIQVMERINAEYRQRIEHNNVNFSDFYDFVQTHCSTPQVQVNAADISIEHNTESNTPSGRIMKVKVISKDTNASLTSLFTF